MKKSQTTIETPKAARYLKALCNHFNRKVDATYTDNHGEVQFGFGYCEMDAADNALMIRIEVQDDDQFDRVKYVVSDHLERFSGEDALQCVWVDEA